MPQLNFLDREPSPPPPVTPLAITLRALASRRVLFGTSSWKYPGWLGSIYTAARYTARGKFSQRRFDDECLAEYAQTFPIVCGDFSFYQFPSSDSWRKLFDSAPHSLQFAFKVPEEITVAVWPKHPRYGTRAGQPNPSFMNPKLMNDLFSKPLTPYRDRVATLILEFGAFSRKTFRASAEFSAALDTFLRQLSPGFRYSVEIRNADFLDEIYLHTLATHNVAHVFNAWTQMPTLADQAAISDAFTADFVVARALLQRARAYEDAVQRFQPYERIQQADPPSRQGLETIARRALETKKSAFLFVNNRLEGYAPGTIEAVARSLV